MNAAGTLGFAPDYRAPVPWDSFGAFVTNPISVQPRKPAKEPALIEYSGGFLMHTGLPNPGLKAAIKKYAHRWADSRLPVIVHLMADRPEETSYMVETLEGLENIAAVELGFAPLLSDDLISLTVEKLLGELPLIVRMLGLAGFLDDPFVILQSASAYTTLVKSIYPRSTFVRTSCTRSLWPTSMP